jgi:hypothetical protein
MPLPHQIPLRYTEQDAGHLSVRPVINQTFRLHELVDMVVSVAGKDPARAHQIFRSGSVIFNSYRYWWDPLSPEPGEIENLLAPFPDNDPARPFVPAQATAVLLEMGGGPQRIVTEILRRDAAQKKLFATQSPWDVLLAWAVGKPARYEKFDHARKADLFRISLPFDQAQHLLAAILAVAPRKLKSRLSTLRPPSTITFLCPRK